jgi:hypothetical protein
MIRGTLAMTRTLFVLWICLLVGCGGGDTAEPSSNSTAEGTATVSGTTTSAGADAPPPELQGVWHAERSGDRVDLNIRGTLYFINHGAFGASGTASVEGEIIRFESGSVCDGVGTYRWTIEGDTLTFAVTEAGEPCDGRLEAFDGVRYER